MLLLILSLARELPSRLIFLEQTPDQSQDNSQQYTENDHRSYWEIEAEVFFFYPDIAGQATYPMEFVVEEVNDNTYHNDRCSKEDDIFTGL